MWHSNWYPTGKCASRTCCTYGSSVWTAGNFLESPARCPQSMIPADYFCRSRNSLDTATALWNRLPEPLQLQEKSDQAPWISWNILDDLEPGSIWQNNWRCLVSLVKIGNPCFGGEDPFCRCEGGTTCDAITRAMLCCQWWHLVGQIGDREILWVRSPKGPESLEPSSGWAELIIVGQPGMEHDGNTRSIAKHYEETWWTSQ